MNIEYNVPNLNKLQKEYDKIKGHETNETQFRFYRLPLGTESVVIRFLPPWSKEGNFAKIVMYHYSIPNQKNILCYRSHDLECKICNFLAENAHKMDLNAFASVTRVFMNALIISDPTQPNLKRLPYIFSGAYSDFKFIYQILTQEKDAKDFFHPINGHNITYKREKYSGKFIRTTSIRPTPIADTEEEIKEILANIYNLDDIWRKPDEKYDEKVNIALMELEKYVKAHVELFADKIQDSQSTPDTIINTNNRPMCFKNHNNSEKCSICPFEFECME